MRYLLILLLLGGCVSANVQRTTEKTSCTASYSSLLKDLSGVRMSACHAEGAADNSTVQIDALIQFLTALKGVK